MKDKLKQLLSLYVPISSDLNTLVDSIDSLYAKDIKSSLEALKTPLKATLQVRIANFKREVLAWNYRNKSKYSNELLEAFCNLWCRIENDGSLKAENETNFKIGGRLATFARMNKQFVKSAQINRLKQAIGSINPLR